MSELQLELEWCDAQTSADRLAQATIARLRIVLGGRCVTALADMRSKSTREAVLVPLHPLAEWLVSNWWHLLYEVETPADRAGTNGFLSRHDMSVAGDGFVLPRLILASQGDRIIARAHRWAPTLSPVEFLHESEATLDRANVEDQLRSVVNATISRLQDRGYSGTWLEEEWARLGELDEAEAEFCRAAAMLGLDPLEIEDGLADSIVAVWNRLSSGLREDLFAVSSAPSISEHAAWVEEQVERTSSLSSGSAWKEARKPIVSVPTDRPWEIGYELARDIHERMSLQEPRFEFRSDGEWGVQFDQAVSPSDDLDGVVSSEGPACVLRERNERGCRFALARAAGSYLARQNGSCSLLTSGTNTSQAITRAFAAELLAPSEVLRKRLHSGEFVSPDAIEELADEFGVSSYVIRHQVVNHNLGYLSEDALY